MAVAHSVFTADFGGSFAYKQFKTGLSMCLYNKTMAAMEFVFSKYCTSFPDFLSVGSDLKDHWQLLFHRLGFFLTCFCNILNADETSQPKNSED